MSSSRLEVRHPDRHRRALALYLLVKEREEGGSTLQFVKDGQRETLVSI